MGSTLSLGKQKHEYLEGSAMQGHMVQARCQPFLGLSLSPAIFRVNGEEHRILWGGKRRRGVGGTAPIR